MTTFLMISGGILMLSASWLCLAFGALHLMKGFEIYDDAIKWRIEQRKRQIEQKKVDRLRAGIGIERKNTEKEGDGDDE